MMWLSGVSPSSARALIMTTGETGSRPMASGSRCEIWAAMGA